MVPRNINSVLKTKRVTHRPPLARRSIDRSPGQVCAPVVHDVFSTVAQVAGWEPYKPHDLL